VAGRRIILQDIEGDNAVNLGLDGEASGDTGKAAPANAGNSSAGNTTVPQLSKMIDLNPKEIADLIKVGF
jgi:hypothetical protein